MINLCTKNVEVSLNSPYTSFFVDEFICYVEVQFVLDS